MPRGADHSVTMVSEPSGARWLRIGIIVMVLGAVASYGIPLAETGPWDAASAPGWR